MKVTFLAAMSKTAACMALQLQDDDLDAAARRGLMHMLLMLCRNMQETAPINASRAAQEEADKIGIGDLRRKKFSDGSRFPGGRGRFHWEHWRPAVDLRDEILRLREPTAESTAEVLRTARICWILQEENSKLNEIGCRTGRSDPGSAYAAAGIELAHEWSECHSKAHL